MDLQEFIEQSLMQIASAITNANQAFLDSSTDARANPAGSNHRHAKSGVTYHGLPDTQMIDFDVAVTVAQSSDETSEKKGGLEIKILSVGAGKQHSTEQSNVSVSRLKFTIPLKLPEAPE